MGPAAIAASIRTDAARRLFDAELKRWQRVAVASVCASALVGILVLDELARPVSSFGALTTIPVAVGAWFLTSWMRVHVVTLGLSIRVVGVALGGVDAVTAAADIGSLLLIAVAVSAAHDYLGRWRVAQARLRSEREARAAVAERERIASELPAHEIRVLFGLTLELQALANSVSDPVARRRIAIVIDKVDVLISDLRAVVYQQEVSDPSDNVTVPRAG